MSVHYKFKSTLNFDTITFDGLHISVGDLKREIIQQKRLGKVVDFDLKITNAQTKEEYKEDGCLIPKNTTLIISRIPIHQNKKPREIPTENAVVQAPISRQDNFNMDLSKMQGSEEEKIHAMMVQSTADYDPKTYHRIKGQSQVGEVPPSYRCNKCKKGGHWIKNCPYLSGKDQFEIKRNTGIPRSFRDKPELSMEIKSTPLALPMEEKQEVPEDLVCGICRDIFVDAVMIPCCGSSFCDDCVRTALLESEDSECPDCKEKNCSPGSLIPNRFLRNSVNLFKNETGYKTGAYTNVKESNATTAAQLEKDQGKSSPSLERSSEQTKAEKTVQPPETDSPEKNHIDESNEENTQSKEAIDTIHKEKDKYDSDYEDNITIKMPTQKIADAAIPISQIKDEQIPSTQSSNSAPQRLHSDSHYVSERDKQRKPTKVESFKCQTERSLLPTPSSMHHSYQNQNINEPPDMGNHAHRVVYKPPYHMVPRGPPMHMMGHPQLPQYNNGYNNIVPRPPMNFAPYPNQPVPLMRPGPGPVYMPPGNTNMNNSQIYPSTNLASIYQGVAAKVGTGLIDDPLEAFNRIMKEKEKNKVDRRRSPDRHRSRSHDRQRHRLKSPIYERCSSRDMNIKDKRPRSRERKPESSYDRRPNRAIRLSPKGSHSPKDKRKRSTHRRSPSPKFGHKTNFKERTSYKPYGPKVETVEPPPPGFESLPIAGPIEKEIHRSKKAEGSVAAIKKTEDIPFRRARSSSKSNEIKTEDNIYGSLTPPTKSKLAYVHENRPRKRSGTPDKNEVDFESTHSPTHKRQRLSNDEKSPETSPMKTMDHLNSSPPTGKENDKIDSLQRKKRKKVKSERKKVKKDKKEKRDKKKNKSPTIEPGQIANSDHIDAQIGTNNRTSNRLGEPDSKMKSSKDRELYDEHINPHKVTEKSQPSKSRNDNNIIERFHVLDSVLDIGSYDTDFDEGNTSAKIIEKNDVNTLCASKWELEDNTINSNLVDPSKRMANVDDQEHNAITSDVIRKAEHAIFAKAINAIRPVEFKVIIDSRGNSKEHTVSIRNDHKSRSPSPKCNINKSVKDRLGSKVVRDRIPSPRRSKQRLLGRDLKEDRCKSPDNSRSRRRPSLSNERFNARDRWGDRERGKPHGQSIHYNDREHEIKTQRNNIRDRDRDSSSNDRNKHKTQFREKSELRNRYENNANRNVKGSENRTISSVASRPCRPDNPFRRKEGSLLNTFNLKLAQHGSSQSFDSNSDDELDKKKRKDKKLKKHAKSSSPEALKSDRRRDLKNKKKNKIVKKKKKSKK